MRIPVSPLLSTMVAALALGAMTTAYAGDPPDATAAHEAGTAVTTGQELQKLVNASTVPVIIDFHASWCGPCRMLAPELAALTRTFQGKVSLVTVDVDQAQDLARAYGVEAIPHLVLVRQGEKDLHRVGFAKRDELARWAGLTK